MENQMEALDNLPITTACHTSTIHTTIIAFLLFLSFSVYVSTTTAADYYVAPSGNDSDPGTLAQPWKTVAKAALTINGGDTVYLRQGIYNEQLIPAHSGSASNLITYTSYPGETATLDGTFSLSEQWAGLIFISGKQYIIISGLTITRAGPFLNNCGILIENSTNIIIEKNYIFDTVSSGIGVWDSQNITIDNNEVEKACNDGEQECITIAGSVDFTVSNNTVHHNGPGTNGGEGIDAKDGSAKGRIINNTVHNLTRLGIYVDAWDKYTHDIEISRNRVYKCKNDGITLASEQGGLLTNISVINNIIYDNRFNGIAVTPNGDVASPPMQTITIINNTFYNNGDGSLASPWGGGIIVDNPNITGLQIKNNIFSDNLLFQITVDVPVSGLVVENNLIDGFRDYENEIKGNSAVSADPSFVSPSTANFNLRATSPAIDSGIGSGAPSSDFNGNPRPSGKGFDIGAFEHQTSASSSPVITGPNFLLLNR